MQIKVEKGFIKLGPWVFLKSSKLDLSGWHLHLLKKQGQAKINSRLNSVQGGKIEKRKQGKSMKNSETGLLNKVGVK